MLLLEVHLLKWELVLIKQYNVNLMFLQQKSRKAHHILVGVLSKKSHGSVTLRDHCEQNPHDMQGFDRSLFLVSVSWTFCPCYNAFTMNGKSKFSYFESLKAKHIKKGVIEMGQKQQKSISISQKFHTKK